MNVDRFWGAVEDDGATSVGIFFGGPQGLDVPCRNVFKLDDGKTAFVPRDPKRSGSCAEFFDVQSIQRISVSYQSEGYCE